MTKTTHKIPRRLKQNVRLTLTDVYLEYKDELPKESSPFFVNYKDFRAICIEFNELIWKHILEEVGEFKFPFKLGFIRIKKTKMNFEKPNKLPIDFKLTKKYNKVIYHLNEHTNGFRYFIYWCKNACKVKGKQAYCFKPVRANSRRLGEILQDPDRTVDYFE